MLPKNFGMLKEPPANFVEALKQIFFDPNLLAIYSATFVLALAIPFFITFCLRKWNNFKLRNCLKVRNTPIADDDQEESPMELPNGMLGTFNRSILDCINRANPHTNIKKNNACPFISTENLTLTGLSGEDTISNCKEEGDESITELETIAESEPLLNEEEKEQKKSKKKYKDPDPETAEALNKLIADGLHGKLATAQLRAKTHLLEEKMSQEEREKEAEIKQQQLSKIFEMMEAQKEKFGISEKEELVEQMKLYSI